MFFVEAKGLLNHKHKQCTFTYLFLNTWTKIYGNRIVERHMGPIINMVLYNIVLTSFLNHNWGILSLYVGYRLFYNCVKKNG